MQIARLAAAVCLFAAACSNTQPAAPPAGELSVSTAASGDGRTPVTVTFENRGASARQVLALMTPGDGIDANILDVRRDGVPVRYIGKQVKPGFGADHVSVDAGERLVMAVDPSTAYD